MDLNVNNGFIIAITGLVFTNIISPIISYKVAQNKTKDDYYNKALQNRYNLIYSPLRTLLLDTHITGAGVRYPRFERIMRTLVYIFKLRIKRALRQLSINYPARETFEVEFGKDFPMDEIKKL